MQQIGEMMSWLNLVMRSLHVIAGVMWIGHLWFFNFVNVELAKTYDAASQRRMVPELMPRALYWFRWGAFFSLFTGLLLLRNVYYFGGLLLAPESGFSMGLGNAVGMGTLLFAFFIYDVVWKLFAKAEIVGGLLSFLLIVGATYGLAQVLTGRAALIHVGGMFGAVMALNVWLRIWPNQRQLITAAKSGSAPDPTAMATAALRSKHNTYLSVPVLFLMISNHYPTMLYGLADDRVGVPVVVAILVGIGWVITRLLYLKSASKAPARYEKPARRHEAPART